MVNQETVSQSSNRKPIRLGIWGLPGSGKTVYMTMLYHYLSQPTKESKWRIVIDDEVTEKFINDNLRLIMDIGTFPDKTPVVTKINVLSYKLINKATNQTIELSFFDCSGELYFDLFNNVIDREDSNQLRLIDYLNQCHGIIIMLSSLTEDYNKYREERGSYFTLLGNFFRSMQRCRKSQTEKLLEPYIVFCLTKIDHPEVYKKALGLKAEESLLKLLGRAVNLGWLETFFYVAMDNNRKSLNLQPNKSNRCQVMRISCFGVDGQGNSPVSKPESNNDKKHDTTNTSQEPEFQTYNSSENNPSENNPYEDDQYTQNQQKQGYKEYKIDTNKDFYPINMLAPIEWIINGIEQYYPEVSSTQTESNNQ